MALVSVIVNRALRLLSVLDVNSAPEAEDEQTAIAALNAMCTRWEANGLAMGWRNVSAPDDTLPAPDEAHEALAYNLALRLAPEYGKTGDHIALDAREFLADFRRDALVSRPLVQCSDLPRGLNGYWNIYTDEPV